MIVSTERDQRQQWLNSLKVGDEVAMIHGGWGYRDYTIHTVSNITPSRMIDVNRYRFNNDGRERGNHYGRKIEQVTDKIRQDILHKQAISEIRCITWEKLTTQQLLDVLKIIQGDESK